jgi:hypothetical protein
MESGGWDSNPRPSAWQAAVLKATGPAGSPHGSAESSGSTVALHRIGDYVDFRRFCSLRAQDRALCPLGLEPDLTAEANYELCREVEVTDGTGGIAVHHHVKVLPLP